MKKIQRIYKIICNHPATSKIIIILILILSIIVRFYKIDNPIADWHSWRQADTASVSRIYYDQGINILYPRYYDISSAQSGIYNMNGYRFVELPIFNMIHALLAKVLTFMTFDAVGRLVSIICATITTFLLYLIGKRYLGRWEGVLAAFFYAFLPFNVYFTRVVLPEPMTVLFSITSLYFFIKFYDIGKNRYLFLTALFFSLAILLKPYSFFYAIPMIIMVLRKYPIKKIIGNYHYYIALSIIIIPFLLWRLWENKFPEGIPFWSWAFNGDGIRFKPSFWRWIFGERLGLTILGIWGLIPFTYAVLAYKKGKEIIHYLLISAFVYLSLIATANVKHDYYQTLIIPVIALTLAYGVSSMWQSAFFNKYISRILVVFSIMMMFIMSVDQVKGYYSVNRWEIIEAGTKVNEITPKDALVVAPYNGDTAFLYQTKRFGWPVVDRPFNEIIDKGADYYVSVNYDDLTNKLIREYKTVVKNDRYVIIDLHTRLL
jgi:4-amino-4-deoxy-L-arabinose transferase-like glycosyltransferase